MVTVRVSSACSLGVPWHTAPRQSPASCGVGKGHTQLLQPGHVDRHRGAPTATSREGEEGVASSRYGSRNAAAIASKAIVWLSHAKRERRHRLHARPCPVLTDRRLWLLGRHAEQEHGAQTMPTGSGPLASQRSAVRWFRRKGISQVRCLECLPWCCPGRPGMTASMGHSPSAFLAIGLRGGTGQMQPASQARARHAAIYLETTSMGMRAIGGSRRDMRLAFSDDHAACCPRDRCAG